MVLVSDYNFRASNPPFCSNLYWRVVDEQLSDAEFVRVTDLLPKAAT
jgi:hypothetical protein